MYNEISYTAKPAGNVGKYVLMGLSGSALIFVVAANITPKFSGLVWMVAFAFVVASIYVYNRYVGAEFTYSVTDGGVPSFVVEQRVGKTVKTMARLDLCSITEVRAMSGKEYRKYKSEKGTLKYSYFPTMFPERLYLVTMRSRYENADVFIEADERFISYLRGMAERKPESYDEY
jgi:hypothetical protein